MRIYISGPISGYPELNKPTFAQAAFLLGLAGHSPINPHDIDPGVPDPTWLDYMRTDLSEMVLQAEGLAMLPGHEESRGARIEGQIATMLGLPVKELSAWVAS